MKKSHITKVQGKNPKKKYEGTIMKEDKYCIMIRRYDIIISNILDFNQV